MTTDSELSQAKDSRVAGGWWVFAHGGLFDSEAVETPPLFHVVNLPGQNAALDGATLCGWARFKEGCAGGAWRPDSSSSVERGDAGVGRGSDNPQVCPRCADALIALHCVADWDAFKAWARKHKRKAVAA